MTSFQRFSLILIFLFCKPWAIYAQQIFDKDYYIKKDQYYKTIKSSHAKNANINKASKPFKKTDNGCFIPLDATYTKLILSNEDDGSSAQINLPFSFNLYGNNYNKVWINNNGNLTFDNYYGEYKATGFPLSGHPMVAAFWGDVDTRYGESGNVFYKITPTRMIITWDHVGYFKTSTSTGTDFLNTFQIIIGLFGDSVLGPNANVKFNYEDMQWATSGSGFNGNPSTVGVNAGDGINYIQVGRFKFNTSDYDGPGGNDDGVNFLDNQCFEFNVTESGNIPPSVSNLDFTTTTLNVGDSVSLDPQFIGPEVGQTVISTVNTRGLCGVEDSITNGSVSIVRLKIKADTCNIGTNLITITATDNGTPTRSTDVNITINVNKLNQSLTFNAIPNTTYGDPTFTLQASAGSGLPVTYSIVSGPAFVSGNTLTTTGVGTVTVRAYQAGNNQYNPSPSFDQSFCVLSGLPAPIGGITETCPGTQYNYTTLQVSGATYSWTATGGATVIQTGNTAKVTFPSAGSYTISVKYNGNCGDAGPEQTLAVQCYDTPLQGSITRMLPAYGSTNLFLPIKFSWEAVENTVYYDLYIWLAGQVRPDIPSFSKITQINYTVYSGLLYDTLYNWQVVAKKACFGIESNLQTFKLRSLPDLITEAVTAPNTATSETEILINWKIKNQGAGATDNIWTDAVYISDLPVYDNLSATSIGQVYNISSLNPGESYTTIQGIKYKIPVGTQGTKYFFVKTNASNSLQESDNTNNIYVSDSVKISLAPPPDLQVTAITLNPSSNVIAGSNMQVNYSVSNNGTGPTSASSWTDRIYLSDSTVLNTSKDVLLTLRYHTGKLQNNDSYNDSASVIIPKNIFGKKYIHLYTDAYNQVYEYLLDGNNIGVSDSFTVFLNPSPNLTVSDITISIDSFTNRQPLTIGWTEKNKGTDAAKPVWYNSVYLSIDTTLNTSSDILFGTISRTNELVQQNSQEGSLTANIPNSLAAGKYYVFVNTDPQNNIFESDFTVDDAEKDNTARSLGQITISIPDLKSISLTGPDTAYSEETIDLSWKVQNPTGTSVYNGSWTDNIYLSDDNSLDNGDILLGSTQITNSFVPAGSEYIKNQAVTIPRSISGNKFIIVSADKTNSIFENDETNNIISNKIVINLSPFADLIVNGIESATTDTLGKPLSVNYTVKNTGSKALSSEYWQDNVYLSPTKNINEPSLILLGSVYQNSFLDSGASYKSNTNFTIPVGLAPGVYYPLVFTDAANSIYENIAENNNKFLVDSILINPLPSIDLSVDSAFITQANIKAGDRIPVTWTVINNSLEQTIVPAWQDAIHLSSDTILSSSDRVLLITPIQKSLKAGETYSLTIPVSIPLDVNGPQYLLVTTDFAGEVMDNIRANNTRVISVNPEGGGTGNSGDTIIITQLPPADLIVTDLQLPAEATASQPITVSYKVKNTATGTTQSNNWKDKLYLSTDFVVSADDILIGTFNHTDSLAAGAEYADSAQVFLPAGIGDNYIALFKTDADNNVYEKDGEYNNTVYANLFVKAQMPCDLQPDSIRSSEPFIISGETANFEWQLLNKGDNPATGYIREAVYLSKDTVWDDKDPLLAFTDGQVNILPGQSQHRQITARPGVAPGKYFPIIRTDILNNLVEINEGNNNRASTDTATVDVKELALNITTQDTLETNIPIYYKLLVPENLVGETLSVTLKGDSTNNAVNRLFISHDTLPNENSYEFTAQEAFKANQQALVPSMLPGNYYITASGVSSQALSKQSVTLLANIIPFSIISVQSDKGGNTGSVTVKINGAKFEPGMRFQLASDSVQITAAKISFISSVAVFATFDLTGQPLGLYTVKAINSQDDTARLINGFEIVAGSAGGTGLSGNGFTCSINNIGYENNFLLDEEHLPTARSNTTAVITVSFQNTGNVDIPVQRRIFLSEDSVFVNFQADYSGKLTELLLECKEDGGPDDVLRPGATGYIKVYALIKGGAHEIIQFKIVE